MDNTGSHTSRVQSQSDATESPDEMRSEGDSALRLHIGGLEAKPGWKILNIQPGDSVDFVGNCRDLSQFDDESVTEVYAAHVLEHLGYLEELPGALAEIHRILVPGGVARLSVPDFELLCRMFVHPELAADARFHIMRIIFGGQTDPHDYHRVGLTWEFLEKFLNEAGFSSVKRVSEFGLFADASSLKLFDNLISLNVEAAKRPDAATD